MTIKTSGSLNTTEIVAEWEGSQPNSLSEYYSGGSLVFSGAADGDGNVIPSSGAISFSDFYNTTAFQAAGSNTTATSSQTITAPSGANALYVFRMVAGGGGGHQALGYDKAGGESPGGGGAGGGAAAI